MSIKRPLQKKSEGGRLVCTRELSLTYEGDGKVGPCDVWMWWLYDLWVMVDMESYVLLNLNKFLLRMEGVWHLWW